jgi:hypothetical protein
VILINLVDEGEVLIEVFFLYIVIIFYQSQIIFAFNVTQAKIKQLIKFYGRYLEFVKRHQCRAGSSEHVISLLVLFVGEFLLSNEK